MPAISNQNQLSETTYNDIIKGRFTDPNFNTFQLFLNFLNDLPSCNAELAPIGRPMHTGRDAVPCIKLDRNRIFEKALFYTDLTKNNHLKNSFNYLKSVIGQPANNIGSTDIEKLLHICHDFFTIPLTNLNLTPIEINDITEAYFDFFASITNLPEIIHIRSNYGNDLQIFNLISLSAGYFNRLNKLNGNASLGIEPTNLTYLIYSPLKNYLKGLGNLALNFRNEYSDADLNRFESNAVNLIKSMTNLTVDQLSNARYTFLSQYHNNPDVLTECKRVFNTTNCDPYQFNTQYNLISQGRTLGNFSAAEALAKKLLFGSKNDITSRLKTLSTTIDQNNGLANFLDYFKATVKEANKNKQVLSINFVKDLSSLAFYLTDMFKETKPKSRIYDSLLSLVLTLLKNPSISNHHLHVWQAIQACTDQMLARLTDQTEIMLKKPQIGIDSSMNILADIFHQTMDVPAVSPSDKKEIGEIIKKLSIACLKIDTCDSFSALSQFSKTLGSMVRSLSKKNKTEIDSNTAQVIETAAQQIIQNANNTISEPELAGLRWSYLKGRYDNNINAIQNDCQRVFSSSSCHEFIAANETKIQEEIFTTVIPETTMPIVVQAMNTTELPSSNSNQTVAVTEANSNNSALTNSGLTLGASAAHSVGSGMLNGIIQYFAAKHSRRGEQTSTTKAMIIYSSLFAHAAFAATFPLMLYKIQEHINQGNEDEAQQLWDNLLLQALPTFISSVGFSLGLQIVYECTQLLSNRVRAIAQNTLPLMGTAVILFKNPVATAVQMATSIVSSSLTYGLFNRISPTNNTKFLDVEKVNEDNIKLNPLNIENDVKPTINGIARSDNGIGGTEINEIIENNHNYISKEKLDEIRTRSAYIIKLLNALVCSLEESIKKDKSKIDPDTNPAVADTYQTIINDKTNLWNIIKEEVENCETNTSFLNDDHEEACKNHVIKNTHNPEEKKKIKVDYLSAMNKLGNVFKHMNRMFDDMMVNLGKAKGYVEGASKSFPDNILPSLNEIVDEIKYPLSLIKNFLNIYNTWDTAEKAEKNGAKKALANKKFFENSIPLNTPQNTLRPKKSRVFLNNRPQSDASDSRTHSSGSEEGSVTSIGSSKDEENVLIVRPLLKSSR
ncbi:MAG TPA: hypothetical protein VGH95_01275 [Candidatus Aquirickettsiella sp.]|jgi:hypothetical protein